MATESQNSILRPDLMVSVKKWMTPNPPSPEVFFEPIENILLPAVGRPIELYLSNPDEAIAFNTNRRNFRIVFGNSPIVSQPRFDNWKELEVFGTKFQWLRSCEVIPAFSGKGIPISDPDSKIIVAEVFRDSICIFPPFEEAQFHPECMVAFKRILEQAADIIEMQKDGKKPQKDVYIAAWHKGLSDRNVADSWPFVQVAREILLPFLDCDIYIHQHDELGVTYGLGTDRCRKGFNIFVGERANPDFFSGVEYNRLDFGQRIFGVPLTASLSVDSSDRDRREQSANGLYIIAKDHHIDRRRIIKSPEGFEVAEFISKNNLCILLPLQLREATNSIPIFKRILIEAVRLLPNTSRTSKQLLRKIEAQESEQLKRLRETVLHDILLLGPKLEILSLKGRIAKTKKETQDLAKRHRHALRKYDVLERKTKQGNRELTYLERAERLLGKIRSVEKVKGVKVFGKSISVETDTLFAKNPRTGKIHEIGKMRITFRPKARDSFNLLQITNLTRKVSAYWPESNAPHVPPNGIPCLGNIQGTMFRLITNYDLEAATILAISFIESVNIEDSAGRYIGFWPVANLK